MADSTESASALPYCLAVPSPNPTQPTQHMPHPTLLYPYYHPHYHLTLPYPSRAPTTTSANPTYGRFYYPCNPQPTTLRQLFNIMHISCNIYESLLSYIHTIMPTIISPHPTPPVLPPPPQTPHIWLILLNLPHSYPTTLLHLAQIPHSPLSIYPMLLFSIPLDIPTII